MSDTVCHVRIGERVLYDDRAHKVCIAGCVVDVIRSPLSGEWMARVCDYWFESSDEGAGKWLPVKGLRPDFLRGKVTLWAGRAVQTIARTDPPSHPSQGTQ